MKGDPDEGDEGEKSKIAGRDVKYKTNKRTIENTGMTTRVLTSLPSGPGGPLSPASPTIPCKGSTSTFNLRK